MPFFHFLAKDRSWNDSVRINQYLFLYHYFWLIYLEYQSVIATDDLNDPLESRILHDLHGNLGNFCSTLLNMLGLLSPFVDTVGEEGIALLMSINEDSKDNDEQLKKVLVSRLTMMSDHEPLSWENILEGMSSLRRTYDRMISVLDTSGELLESTLNRDSMRYSNPMILRIWHKLQDSYFKDTIRMEGSTIVPLERRELWINRMDRERLDLLHAKVREITEELMGLNSMHRSLTY